MVDDIAVYLEWKVDLSAHVVLLVLVTNERHGVDEREIESRGLKSCALNGVLQHLWIELA